MEAIARKNLADSRLVAPFSGVIGNKSAESGENVLPNQPVYTLLKIEDVKIKVAVPEKEIADILKNQRARISVPALHDASYEGIIEERGIVADPGFAQLYRANSCTQSCFGIASRHGLQRVGCRRQLAGGVVRRSVAMRADFGG